MKKIILFSLLFSFTLAPQQMVCAAKKFKKSWFGHPAVIITEAVLIGAGITVSVLCKKKIINKCKENVRFLKDLVLHLEVKAPKDLTPELLQSPKALAFAETHNKLEFLENAIENQEAIKKLIKKYKWGQILLWGGICLSGISGALLIASVVRAIKDYKKEKELDNKKKDEEKRKIEEEEEEEEIDGDKEEEHEEDLDLNTYLDKFIAEENDKLSK